MANYVIDDVGDFPGSMLQLICISVRDLTNIIINLNTVGVIDLLGWRNTEWP